MQGLPACLSACNLKGRGKQLVCELPLVNINVDDFVLRAAAEAAGEEDSSEGASPNPSSDPNIAQVFYCLQL